MCVHVTREMLLSKIETHKSTILGMDYFQAENFTDYIILGREVVAVFSALVAKWGYISPCLAYVFCRRLWEREREGGKKPPRIEMGCRLFYDVNRKTKNKDIC